MLTDLGYTKKNLLLIYLYGDNHVALGAIETPMHKIEAHDFLKSLQPIGRMGKIDEVVGAVMYLNDAKFVTGEVLHVDGGAHAGKW